MLADYCSALETTMYVKLCSLIASTRQIPNLLLKEAFRNSLSLSAVLVNPIYVGPCSFCFHSPGLHCLQGLGMLGSGLLLIFLQFSISGHAVLSRKRELFAQVAFHSNIFFPKYYLDSEVLGSADRFLPADPHVQNPIWSLKFCMDVETREIDYTLRLLTCFLPVINFSSSRWLLVLYFVVWSFHIKDRCKIKSSEVPKPCCYPVGFKNKFLFRKIIY